MLTKISLTILFSFKNTFFFLFLLDGCITVCFQPDWLWALRILDFPELFLMLLYQLLFLK